MYIKKIKIKYQSINLIFKFLFKLSFSVIVFTEASICVCPLNLFDFENSYGLWYLLLLMLYNSISGKFGGQKQLSNTSICENIVGGSLHWNIDEEDIDDASFSFLLLAYSLLSDLKSILLPDSESLWSPIWTKPLTSLNIWNWADSERGGEGDLDGMNGSSWNVTLDDLMCLFDWLTLKLRVGEGIRECVVDEDGEGSGDIEGDGETDVDDDRDVDETGE